MKDLIQILIKFSKKWVINEDLNPLDIDIYSYYYQFI